jgi:hypothetical protein
METFRPPAMSLIELSMSLARSLTAASRSKQSGVVVADHDDFVHSPFGQTSPFSGQRAQSLALE